MKKFDRLVVILSLLNDKKVVSVNELKSTLGVSKRSIYRYIRSLQDAGFPIYYNFKGGGYSFSENYSLKKGILSPEEQLVLALAKELIDSSLGTKAKEILDRIEKNTFLKKEPNINNIYIQKSVSNGDIINKIKLLASAISEHQLVSFKYKKENILQKRIVEPYFLYWTGDFWYLQAWCRTQKARRTFSLNNIKQLEILEKYFVPKSKLLKNALVYEAIGPYVDTDKEEVVFQIAPEIKDTFLRKKWVKDQKVIELENDWLEITFKVRGLKGLKFWLYRWIPYFKIISPRWLKEEMLKELKKTITLIQH